MVTRLKRKGTEDVLIDVMKPIQQPHQQVFKHTVTVEEKGQRTGFRPWKWRSP